MQRYGRAGGSGGIHKGSPKEDCEKRHALMEEGAKMTLATTFCPTTPRLVQGAPGLIKNGPKFGDYGKLP